MDRQRFRSVQSARPPARPARLQQYVPPAQPQPVQPAVTTTSIPQPVAPRAPLQPATVAASDGASATVHNNLIINIQVPKFRKPHLRKIDIKALIARRPDWPYKKIGIIATAVVIVATGATVGMSIVHDKQIKDKISKANLDKVAARAAPSFTPVAPAEKTGLASGKAGDTAYDGVRNSYSYQDTLQGVTLTVSQQPVPAKFTSAEEAVTKIAAEMKAQQKIKTTKGDAYLASDDKTNAQTIVYSVNNLLVFVNSPFKHDPLTWAAYLENLK